MAWRGSLGASWNELKPNRPAELNSYCSAQSRLPKRLSSLATQLGAGRVELTFGSIQVLADLPSKIEDASGADGVLMSANLQLIRSAHFEVLIVSPYVIPGERGLQAIKEAITNNALLSVVTNSISTTDEPLVHLGYSRYRHALLEMGAALYELMPSLEGRNNGASEPHGSLGRLHAKMAVVDRQRLYIGSMNMDRRSAHCNTEVGLIVDSPEVASAVAKLLLDEHLQRSFRLRKEHTNGQLQWVSGSPPREIVHSAEPGAGFGRELRLRMTAALIDEELL